MDTRTVFSLRSEAKNLVGEYKETKLSEALAISRRLYEEETEGEYFYQPDEWIVKAYAWVLIDLVKYYIDTKDLVQASSFFQELLALEEYINDGIVESQIKYLRPKVSSNYNKIFQARELSKRGSTKEALMIFNELIRTNALRSEEHEEYGWAIYRHLKAEMSKLNTLEVRQFLRDYINLDNPRPSMLHSTMLNFALAYSKQEQSFEFYKFFCAWNPTDFRQEDWEEARNGEKVYKPLVRSILKEMSDVMKNKELSTDYCSTLIPFYKTAIRKFPEDDFLKRNLALLYVSSNKPNLAIELYKELCLSLSKTYYIWAELAKLVEDKSIKIGLFCKALSLEKNEDFLGDIHLSLAEVLIEEGLLEYALLELNTYQEHRSKKKWSFAPNYASLYQKVEGYNSSKPNRETLFQDFIPIAEDFVFAEIPYCNLVLAERWKDKDGRAFLKLIDNNSLSITVKQKIYPQLSDSKLGDIIQVKLYKKDISETKDTSSIKAILELLDVSEENRNYKYVPLVIRKTALEAWSILDTSIAVVDYINIEKGLIHAITSDGQEVFFPKTKECLEIGDFVCGNTYVKQVKTTERLEIKHIKKILPDEGLIHFPRKLAVIDNVNKQKALFHFVISRREQGIVFFRDTELRPQEGDFVEMTIASKLDKKTGGLRVKALALSPTSETNSKLKKTVLGLLRVTHRDDRMFGFIEDYYVPQYLLEEHCIYKDCNINAIVVYTGEGYKVIDLFY